MDTGTKPGFVEKRTALGKEKLLDDCIAFIHVLSNDPTHEWNEKEGKLLDRIEQYQKNNK